MSGPTDYLDPFEQLFVGLTMTPSPKRPGWRTEDYKAVRAALDVALGYEGEPGGPSEARARAETRAKIIHGIEDAGYCIVTRPEHGFHASDFRYLAELLRKHLQDSKRYSAVAGNNHNVILAALDWAGRGPNS